jgi:hypothetical protein
MPKVISFDDALKVTGGKDCSLLLGNGFSARYFSYRSLLDKADLKPDDPVRALFDRLTTAKRFPLYVAEGTSAAKLQRIKANNYLSYCYEKLGASAGSFFVFGHSADPNDAHIYSALFRSKITHLYFCIYQPTDEKVKSVSGELARYRERASSKIDYTFVDSESAHVWDRPPPEAQAAMNDAATIANF